MRRLPEQNANTVRINCDRYASFYYRIVFSCSKNLPATDIDQNRRTVVVTAASIKRLVPLM
jgi:hypothetical protein